MYVDEGGGVVGERIGRLVHWLFVLATLNVEYYFTPFI
jgi:hypothetical protein